MPSEITLAALIHCLAGIEKCHFTPELCDGPHFRRNIHTADSNLSVSGEIVASRANFPALEPAGLPLPSTGRGNEGEGWCDEVAPVFGALRPFHPSPRPVEGRGLRCAVSQGFQPAEDLSQSRRLDSTRKLCRLEIGDIANWKSALRQTCRPSHCFNIIAMSLRESG